MTHEWINRLTTEERFDLAKIIGQGEMNPEQARLYARLRRENEAAAMFTVLGWTNPADATPKDEG